MRDQICTCCFVKHPGLVPDNAAWEELSTKDLQRLRSIADQDDLTTMQGAMHVINATRILRVVGNTAYREVGLLSFPQEFSTKNIVLHGVATKP